MIRSEVLVSAGARLGEGPLWDQANGDVVWVDIMAEQVLRTRLSAADLRRSSIGEPVGSLAATADGGLVGATPTGLRRLDRDGAPHVARFPECRADLRANDGKAAPGGRFVVGTMSVGEPELGAGSLWAFGHGQPSVLVADTTISNGLAWSSDGSVMYFIDTPTQQVVAFDHDIEAGTVGSPRPHVVVDPVVGAPDGMCIDEEGGLWIALWGGCAVHRYLDGVLDAVVEVPTPLVTCPAFVGDDLSLLVVTTASLDAGGADGAGDLYVVEPGVRGSPIPVLGTWAETWD